MEGGSHLVTFSGGGELMMRNGRIRIRPRHLRVEMMTTTGGCNVTGGRRQAGTWGDIAGPLGQSGDKTQILHQAGS